MQFNKKQLVLAVASVLAAGSVYAQPALAAVDISANPVNTVKFAQEIKTTPPATLINTGSGLNLASKTNYAMSAAEVRFARFGCSSNMKFDTGSTVSVATSTNGGNPVSVGNINGLGTNAIFFSLTAGTGTLGVPSDTLLTISGGRTVSSTSPDVECTFALYDDPSNAGNGGELGRIPGSVSTGIYIDFTPGLVMAVTPLTQTADVEATPVFSKFLNNSTGPVPIGYLTSTVPTAVNGIDGLPLQIEDLLKFSSSSFTFNGDFSARGTVIVAYNDGSSSGMNCASTLSATGTITDTTATFAYPAGITGNDAATFTLCYTVTGTEEIPVATYDLSATLASTEEYTVPTPFIGNRFGNINHNGTELQAPFVQTPEGWNNSRVVLTNKGTLPRPYSIRVLVPSSQSAPPLGAAATGTLAAGSTTVLPVRDIVTFNSTVPYGTLIATVAAPESEIDGLYQVANPQRGLTNYVLSRPAPSPIVVPSRPEASPSK